MMRNDRSWGSEEGNGMMPTCGSHNSRNGGRNQQWTPRLGNSRDSVTVVVVVMQPLLTSQLLVTISSPVLSSVAYHWDPLGFIGIQWDLFASIWIHLDPFRFIELHLDPLQSFGIPWDILWSIGIHLDPLRSIGIHWDPLGSIWIHWDPFWAIGIYWDPLSWEGERVRGVSNIWIYLIPRIRGETFTDRGCSWVQKSFRSNKDWCWCCLFKKEKFIN